jgi:hypothetical protein
MWQVPVFENGSNKSKFDEEIKNRLCLFNACSHSVQNILPPYLLLKNIKLKYTELYVSL